MQPDVICLQEVTPSFIKKLKASQIFNDYTCSDISDSAVLPYGVLTLAKKELRARYRFVDLPTSMDRRLLIADIPDEKGLFRIGNVHLESLNSQPTREAQLRICADALRANTPSLHMLCGDFNFCSNRNYYTYPTPPVLHNACIAHIFPEARDAWLDLHDPGYTFDGSINCIITNPLERMRYDRILYASRGNAWSAASVEIVGNSPILEGGEDQKPIMRTVTMMERRRRWRSIPRITSAYLARLSSIASRNRLMVACYELECIIR